MQQFGRVIPVISGKGGVGKSTVAVNLAIALAQTGAKVGLLDCDLYGPSIPTLMGGGQVVPDHEERLIPPAKYGIKYMSLGFFLRNPDDAIMWRGPMFNKAINQMFQDVNWGVLDYLVIDMPPGTGDAHISLTQLVKLAGAVVVTTPQEVALADVRKSMNMLRKENVEIIGIVENMSGLPLPDGSVLPVFGEGGGEKTAREFGVPLLSKLPIDVAIRAGGDAGTPVVCGEGPTAEAFRSLAARVIEFAAKHPSSQSEVSIVN
jgi:ATP-binding protein involved in chromosome partitioning